MKIYNKKSNSLFASVCIAGLLTLLLSSCLKTPADNNPVPLPAAAVLFVQASPDEPSLDFLLGTDRVNQLPIPYEATFNYFNVAAGSYKATFYADAATTTILTDSVHFNQNTAYTLFLANKPSHAETFLLTDTITKPAAGNAAIRFVNVSPDAPAVDLVIKGGAVVVANKSYKGYSSFVPIPGIHYSFEVHQAGTSTVLATLNDVNLSNGFLYTIWFHGLAAGTTTTDKLSIGIINNAYFL